MLKIIDTTTDPNWNLAAEEYILKKFDEPVFRLWQNADSVIVGRHQNAYAEINTSYVSDNHIPVVRRLTGGGAVFHDLGNVNYSFFNLKDEKFCDVIISSLNLLGLNVSTSGRNDILLDGHKISGTAVCRQGGHVLEHGTLLFSASIDRLSSCLNSRKEKYVDKAVKSARSRVANISDYLGGSTDIECFMNHLEKTIYPDAQVYTYTEQDVEAIRCLYDDKYSLDSWNFGRSPKYSLKNIRKFPSGLVEVYMDVNDGVISGLEIFGDYFFSRPTDELCEALIGCEHSERKIADRLSSLAVDDYIRGISSEELIRMLF